MASTAENETTLGLGYKATAISTASDILLAVAKFIAGTLGNSSALIADAVHSLSDLVTDFVSFISLKVSHMEPDEKHPYGHGRAESIGTAVIGLIVIAIGLGIAWEEQKHFYGSAVPSPGTIALIGGIVSLVVKEFLFFYTLRIGKKARSESVIANAWHHRSDSLSSLAAVIGIGGSMMGYWVMDPLAAVVVGLMITHMGGKITWEAAQSLMDPGLSPEELSAVTKIISNAPGVVHHHGIKTRKAGRDIFMDVHIQVEPRISVSEAHNIAESVRRQLHRNAEHITDTMIHIDAEDDQEGRLYPDRRPEVEEAVIKALIAFPAYRLAEDIVIHYFLDRVAIVLVLDGPEGVNADNAKMIAADVKNRLFAGGIITEVVIQRHLGKWSKGE